MTHVVAAHLIDPVSLNVSSLFFPPWYILCNDILFQFCPPIHELFPQLFNAYRLGHMLGFLLFYFQYVYFLQVFKLYLKSVQGAVL